MNFYIWFPFSSVVVMVVQDGEQNSYDQRHLEHSFYEK